MKKRSQAIAVFLLFVPMYNVCMIQRAQSNVASFWSPVRHYLQSLTAAGQPPVAGMPQQQKLALGSVRAPLLQDRSSMQMPVRSHATTPTPTPHDSWLSSVVNWLNWRRYFFGPSQESLSRSLPLRTQKASDVEQVSQGLPAYMGGSSPVESRESSTGAASALVEAIKKGSAEEEIRELIRASRINLNALYEGGQTIMHFAARYGVSPQIIRILKDAGAQINVRDNKGITPLSIAIDNEKYKTVEALLLNGADANVENLSGKVPLYYLQKNDRPTSSQRELIKLLEPFTDKSGWFVITPQVAILRAVYANNVEQIRKMLDQNPLLVNIRDTSDDTFDTLLHKKAKYEDSFSEAVFRALVSAGADVNARNKSGETPLHSALSSDNEESVKILLELGANPNIPSRMEKTPLHIAVDQHNEKVVKLLLKFGANPNIPSEIGETALALAQSYPYKKTL